MTKLYDKAAEGTDEPVAGQHENPGKLVGRRLNEQNVPVTEIHLVRSDDNTVFQFIFASTQNAEAFEQSCNGQSPPVPAIRMGIKVSLSKLEAMQIIKNLTGLEHYGTTAAQPQLFEALNCQAYITPSEASTTCSQRATVTSPLIQKDGSDDQSQAQHKHCCSIQ